MESKTAEKFGEILGMIGIQESHLRASADTIKAFQGISPLENSAIEWLSEGVEGNKEVYKAVEELWEMVQEETNKF